MKIIYNPTLPPNKLRKTRFSTVPTRNGKESIPFCDLDIGIFDIEFRTDIKYMKCSVHHWLSMYGYAWELLDIYETGKLT